MKSLFGILVVLLALLTGSHGAGLQRMCSFYETVNTLQYSREPQNDREPFDGDDDGYDYQDPIPTMANNFSSDSESIICGRTEDYCYALWSLDGNQNVTLKKQGCWGVSDSRSICDNSECVTEYNPATKEKFLFCCCMANLCNARVTWKIITTPDIPSEPIVDEPDMDMGLLMGPVVWLALAIIFLLLITLISVVLLRRTFEDPPKPETAPLAPAGPGYSSNLQNVDNLKLVSLLGQGKYGTVWKGMVNERSVAVKIFPSHNKQYFLNEKDIYNVPLMEHKSLLAYFGCDERRTIDDRIEYMLVLSLAQLGCLQDWLIENTTSFSQFCKMASGVAQGLSHLHSVVRKGDVVKPSICHRDLNTRNILVKADMTCCICDFGFALKTFGSRYEYKGELTLAETKSIMEVGTLRYMAPEVLEGAVNLKDCESALKQIDVYSLGLVIWELATRCHDFYGRGNVPLYMAPYEAEVGKHPSYEQMQIIVSRQKLRPTFPDTWGCGTTKVVKETCEDCWDGDSEARLTSLCVEERLKDLCRDRKTHNYTIVSIANGERKIKSKTLSSNDGLIITPPNQMSITADTTDECSYYTGRDKEYVKPLTKSTSKGQLPKPVRKEKFPFKLPGKKLKKNKIEKTFQGWHGVRSMIQKKLFKRMKLENDDQSVASNPSSEPPTPKSNAVRPTNLDIIPQRYCSQPRRVKKASVEVATVDEKVEGNRSRLRSSETKESAKLDKKIVNSRLSLQPIPDYYLNDSNPPVNYRPRIVVSKSANAMRQLDCVGESSLKRQRSLEVFRDVFGSRQSTEHLRDPSQRVKTPGDVPPAVRKTRASKTLSLYDDRMMGWDTMNTI